MRELAEYIEESFYNNVGSVLTTLLDRVVEKERETTPDDLYVSLNNLADYLVKNNLLKSIKVKGYRFNKYPGIYINYINSEDYNLYGIKRRGILLRIIEGYFDETYKETVANNALEAYVSTITSTNRETRIAANIDTRHNINYTLKSYIINELCTDPSISHYYYISDEKVVRIIRDWLNSVKRIDGVGKNIDGSPESIKSITSLDKLQ